MATPTNITGLTTQEDMESSPTTYLCGSGKAWATDRGTTTDIKKQGSQSVALQASWPANQPSGIVAEISSLDASGTNDYIWVWVNISPRYISGLKNRSAGGLRIRLFSGTLDDTATPGELADGDNNWVDYYVSGADVLSDGWNRFIVCPSQLTASESGGSFDNSDITAVGVVVEFASNQSINNSMVWLDAIHTGVGINFAGGSSSDPVSLDDLATYTEDSSRAWGIVQDYKGVKFLNGEINAGVSGQTTYFHFDNEVLVFEDQSYYQSSLKSSIDDKLHAIKATAGTTTDIQITNSVIAVGGTNGKFAYEFDNASIDLVSTGNTINGSRSIKFASGQTITGKFNNCSQIQTNSASFTDFVISGYSGTGGSLLWDSNIKDGKFNDNDIAIEHTSSSDATYDNLKFSGDTYSVNNSSGSSLDVYLKNGSDADDESTTGSTVNFYNYPVDTTITVQETDGTAISGARVLAYASDSTGDLPYQESVTITRSGTTATVSHTSHGLSTGDKVLIEGSDQNEYNGVHQITVVDSNSYTYTVSGSPTSPATGTITSTGVVVSGTTDSNGQITVNKSFSQNQPITGRVRKATSSPLYKEGNISGTINYLTGLDLTVMLVSDE